MHGVTFHIVSAKMIEKFPLLFFVESFLDTYVSPFQVSQFNVVTKILLASRYLLMPTSTNSSTAKYARPGMAFEDLTFAEVFFAGLKGDFAPQYVFML